MNDTAQDFADFVVERQQALLRFAMVLCGDARLAEDVVADVLSRAYERWAKITALDHPYAYVRRMIVNEYISWRRRRDRSIVTASVDGYAPDVPDPAEAHSERAALDAQLATLPRQQRATLVLRYYEGLSDTEVADVLGCVPSTVRSNASRALHTLRITNDSPVEQTTHQTTK